MEPLQYIFLSPSTLYIVIPLYIIIHTVNTNMYKSEMVVKRSLVDGGVAGYWSQ